MGGQRARLNVFDYAQLFAVGFVVGMMLMAGGCGYAAETRVTPAESSVTAKSSSYRLEVSRAPLGPQNALCQSTVVRPAPSNQPKPQTEWRVQWTEAK